MSAKPWHVATVKQAKDETATARTLTLDVPGWPGHQPGMHVTAKLTAADGYSAQRDYSIASAPHEGGFEITVQRVDDGEVSSYLTEQARPGDQFDVRGPIGGWFTWAPANPAPVLLLAGGSGIVPLMSIIRTHAQVKSKTPLQLIYSVRTPADVMYADELPVTLRHSPAAVATLLYTRLTKWRGTPAQVTEKSRVTDPKTALPGYAGRLSEQILAKTAFPPALSPAIYACGPNGFVETASSLLLDAGYAPETIKTERFG